MSLTAADPLPVERYSRGLPDLARMRAAEPRYFDLGVLLLLAMLPLAAAMSIDLRAVDGANAWVKPLKFAFSLSTYLLTLAFFAALVPSAAPARRSYRFFASGVVLAILVEMAWLVGAAMLGVRSHFNTSPLGQAIFPLMGLLAICLTSATTVQGVGIWRARSSDLAPALRESIALGLLLVLPLTLLSAGVLASMGGNFIGAGEPVRLPVMGWAMNGGDLRVAHFFATHAMHVLPAVGLGLTMTGRGTRRGLVRLAAAAYAVLVLGLMAQAMMGLPLIPSR